MLPYASWLRDRLSGALFLLLIAMIVTACSPPPAEEELPELALKLTASAVPPEGATSAEAATPVSQDELAARATQLARELQETAAFVAEQEKQGELDAFATEAPLRRELATYGILDGQLTGLYEPVSLEQTAEEEYAFYKPSFAAHARDFVVTADITWNAVSEDSGCGFVVRSNGDEEALNQYVLGISRSGKLLFAEQLNGEIDANQVLEVNAAAIDPQFNPANEATNRVAIIGRDQNFNVYSNGQLLGTITAQAGLADGFVTFIAVNESGGVRCDFNNAWLWEMH